jgi:RNA polymerase sigma factor (sigma-70 family)
MNPVLRQLRRAALLSAGDGPPDAQLLESFLARRDEAAFEALLRRHGPMVLGVCRRVLRNTHDAEDAFQATFLVLARKGGSIRSRQVVASWLYGVAYRTAMKARAMSARRRAREKQAAEASRPDVRAGGVEEELLERLDHELSRLPDKYRVPVNLCELEGKSRRDAARMLGLPEGTLSWRLAYAKKKLGRRLSRYGPVAVAALLAEGAASACPPGLLKSTAEVTLAAGAIPAKVMALTEGVLKAMLLSKLKVTICAAGLMALAGVGATGLTYRAAAQQPALASRPAADELEALGLEIEALRKSLQATRERVRALEDEVQALKGRGEAPQGMMMGGGKGKMPRDGIGGGRPGGPRGGGAPTGGTGGPPVAPLPPTSGAPPKQPDAGGDPLAEAEAALKRLQEDPGDRRATEALERALKRLKEREKPKGPFGG